MASANNNISNHPNKSRQTITKLNRLKQSLKLLIGATQDIPSTRTRARGTRGVMFRDKAHSGETVANFRNTVSRNDATRENLEFEKQLKQLLKTIKPGLRFRDKAKPGNTIANIIPTLSHNEAKRETLEIERELIEQIAALYSTIQQYEKALRSDGTSTHSSGTNNNNFNVRVKKAINNRKSRTSRNSTA